MSGTTFVLIYLLIGCILSTVADVGHKRRYGLPLEDRLYLGGIFLWLPFIIMGRRKK